MYEGSPGQASIRSRLGSSLLLLILCATLFLPGISTVPPTDRDESRYAEATRQMVASGDYVRPRFQDQDQFQKPIGAFWAQSIALLATGETREIWPYRLPSVLGATAAVFLTAWIGGELFGGAIAILGAVLLASSALLVALAHAATTDAILLAALVGAQACLAKIYVGAARGEAVSRWYACGFWIAQGVAILIKGPVAPLISGLTVAALALSDRWQKSSPESQAVVNVRWARELRISWAPLLTVAVAAPWFIAIGFAAGGEFFREFAVRDMLPKLRGSFESHGAPPGYYLALALFTFWPGSIFLVGAVRDSLRRASEPAIRFCLAWLIPAWLVIELIPTKLPHYVLPLYPALALIVARFATYPISSPIPATSRLIATVLARTNLVLWAIVSMVGGAVIVAAPIVLGSGWILISTIAAIIAAAVAIGASVFAWRGRLTTSAWAAVAASIILMTPTFAIVIPSLDALWLSRDASVAISAHRGERLDQRPVAALGYSEPSLVFTEGGAIRLIAEPGQAVGFLTDHPDGLLLVSSRRLEAFEQAARAAAIRVNFIWLVDGINYSKGRRERLILFERSDRALR